MPLCETCQNIPWTTIPQFPEHDYRRNIPGLQHTHPFHRKRELASDSDSNSANPAFASVRHHADLQSLEQSGSDSGARCDICRLILRQVRQMLDELDASSFKDQLYYRPSLLDVWINRRPGDSNGYWVVSDCAPSVNKEWIIPIAAFDREELPLDHSLPLEPSRSEIRGRHTSGQTELANVYTLIDSWMIGCGAFHDFRCSYRHDCPPLPSTLIAVGNEQDSCVTLVRPEPDPTRPESCWYAALSYLAADKGREIARLWDDQTQLEDTVLLSILPILFQDAIKAARGIGLAYIWIDSLCASAGCTRDAREVADAFAGARLTISATACKDINAKLLPEHASGSCVALQNGRRDLLLTPLPIAKDVEYRTYIEMADEPLSKSVWSFQERVLSLRTVHFATDQLYFECMNQFKSEDGLLERMRYHTDVLRLSDGIEHYRPKAFIDTPLSRWASIMYDYGKREGSPSDKALAISNVARAFQPLVNDEYVAGHWRGTLLETLCWAARRACKIADSVPSWSWLSIHGVPSVRPRDMLGEGTAVTELASINDIKVVLADSGNPYGCVTEASIFLDVPVVPMEQFETEGYRGMTVFKVRPAGGNADGFMPPFDDQMSLDTDPGEFPGLLALIIGVIDRRTCTERTCKPSQSVYGLLVVPVDDDSQRYKRVGMFITTASHFEPLVFADLHRLITLV